MLTRDKIRVLVIDDDNFAREFISEVLRSAGFPVVALASTTGVHGTLARENIDVIVVDVVMPNMRGDKFTTLLRKNPQTSDIGVVIVSGCESDQLDAIAADVDADAVVSKADVKRMLPEAVMRAARRRSARTR